MVHRLPVLKPREILKVLLKAGFYIHHQRGSHVQLKHPQDPTLRVTVPCHSSFDLPVFVVKSILKQANLSEEQFAKLLRK